MSIENTIWDHMLRIYNKNMISLLKGFKVFWFV